MFIENTSPDPQERWLKTNAIVCKRLHGRWRKEVCFMLARNLQQKDYHPCRGCKMLEEVKDRSLYCT